MNALLLAAGLGTRLRPVTDHTPKCLVEIDGRPLLDYWLRDLEAAGVKRFLLNTHHLAEKVEAYVAKHPLRANVQTVYEEELLGTAGTLAKNSDFCAQSTTLVAHADNLCLCNWSHFFQAHANRPEDTVMTMMTFHTPTPQSCGIVEIDSRGVVQQFFEKQLTDHGNLANAAIYLIEPSVISWLSSQPPITDISTELIPQLLGKINSWYNRGTLIDIGNPASLESANQLIQTGGYL